MKWSWLRAVILGVVIGPAPVAAEPAETDAESLDAERSASARPSGGVERGPHFYVWDEDEAAARGWARELVGANARSPAWAHWREAAASRAALAPVLTGELERDLEGWIDGAEEGSGAVALGFLLCLLPGLDRTCLVSAWATSPRESTRRALAGALAAPFEAVGVREAIAQLSADPSAEVRRLARSAAGRHGIAGS